MKVWILVLFMLLGSLRFVSAQQGKPIPKNDMEELYQIIKTPFKYGLVLVAAEPKLKLDCPTIYRKGAYWYMTYIVFGGRGYETHLAKSKDLLNWEKIGAQLSFGDKGSWDDNQKAGYNALVDPKWGGSYKLGKFDNKYWMSYFGGKEMGYEVEPLAIGMAYTDKYPTNSQEWKRLSHPVLAANDVDVRWWENRNKLFKSTVIEDPKRQTGHRFVMYYNAVGDSLSNNKKTRWYERIGMAVSDDLINWKRFKTDPVVHHPVGITGDPVLQKIGKYWVMFYFGAFWKDRDKAFNRFAASKDLINWTDWEGNSLIEPSEKFDAMYAHKSAVIKHKGIVYHFYCAVDQDGNRGIAVATSRDLGTSVIKFRK